MEASERERSGLVLGLGNPGERYRDSRHNLGFRVLDRLAKDVETGVRRLECNSWVAASVSLLGLYLAWPQTYMNRSGYAARCLAESLEVEPRRILVVYDDVMLPLGRIRIRSKGSPGGHRGMESIVSNLRTEQIPRLRLGIGRDEAPDTDEDLSDYVLSTFDPDELEIVEKMTVRAANACQLWWREGIEATMNRFNSS